MDYEALRKAAVRTEKDYPFDYRFRNRPIRQMIELGMRKPGVPMQDFLEAVIKAGRTDPRDFELLWNVMVFELNTGNKSAALAVATEAAKIAPYNARIKQVVTKLGDSNGK